MKLLFNVLTAEAAVFPAIAAENGDTVFVDFGELDQSPPVFYNRQRTMPAIMSPQVNTSMAVGEIPFSESVTPSGGKIYNVPVAVSEESRLRPEVSLLYNSQGAEGAAGYGWSISGVSAISVVNMTLHYDGVASSPDLSDPDGCAFALDGVRLLEREDAADGFAFETAEGFVRARKVKSGGALTRFDVRYPDGRAAVFGFSDSYETSHIYPVTEITDPDGSKMFYDYFESGNTYYVSHIYYGGKDRAGCYGHVSFEYSDVSGFPASYVAGVEIKPGKILKKIVSSVKVNGAETELMHYDLTHSGDSWHFLTKISAGCGTETLNPLSFDYGYSGMDEGVLQLFSDKYLQTETTFTYQNNATASRYHVGLPLTKSVKRTRGGDQWTDKETYTYDAAGRPLTRVLHTGTSGTVKKEETRWTYDAWGNVLSEMSSPYGSGVFTGTTYAYDSSGRYLTEATGALGLATTYSGFDKHGNPQSEEDFRGNVTSYSYDTFGRLACKSLPTGAVQTVAFSWGGDDGVPTGVLYAGGRVYHELLYTYSHGTLSEMTLSGGGGTVWKLTEMNGMGMPTKAVTGGIQREYGYTDWGMPLYRKFGAHQHFTYDFDPHTGNLMSRTDASRGITEEYGYDNLNRLTDENGRETEYADNGSMVSRDGVGTATYNAAPNAYRLKGLAASPGNGFSYSPLSIDYTSFSRPVKITKYKYQGIVIADRRNRTMGIGDIAVRDSALIITPVDTLIHSTIYPIVAKFTYNERGERVKMEVTEGDVLACRYYIGGVYEVDEVTGEERLYIGGDAYTAPAVDICNADGEWELHFIGRDYLGSVTHIADSKGNLVAEYSYDAWGRLRDPATQEHASSDLLLWRGFTGHEWLPWFGLYNMNARLYDPVLGRFLSPDPYVQMPDNTQNLNRYLYALNNPFQYTDPSGEFLFAAIFGFFKGLFKGKNPFKTAWKAVKNEARMYAGLFIADKNKNFFGKLGQVLSRWTWELPQTIFGLAYSKGRNWAGKVDAVHHYRGATYVINEYGGKNNGITFGSYININDKNIKPMNSNGDFDPTQDGMYMHEYGHYLQSMKYGWGYLISHGIPSLFDAKKSKPINKYLSTHDIFWVEIDANQKAKKHFEENENVDDWNELMYPVTYPF